MLTPLLSEEDPVASSEGSLDPLGLYQIADSLAVRLVPGVRQRQQHPRFLTASAVSLAVCSQFDEDTFAKDGVSEPWQVFEWYLVEGLVRAVKEKEKLPGLPGRDKVTRTINDQVPLSAKRYLKTPTVFGFHGVYRLLSRTLRINAAGRLGDAGYELLDVWRAEQKLRGFYESAEGDGQQGYRLLVDAVKAGVAQGAVARSTGWNGWQFMADHLCHTDVGPKEARMLAGFLLSEQDGNGNRKALLQFLVSPEGQKICNAIRDRNARDKIWSEREFHVALAKQADSSLGLLLAAILSYETFARVLQDAFDDCLYEMSMQRGKTPPSILAKQKNVLRAVKKIPDLLAKTADALAPFGLSVRFQELFGILAERTTPEGWAHILLEHHKNVQMAKPPCGKAPWFDRMDDGRCVIRPAYLRDNGGRGDESYVHNYRVAPLWSFATDLRLL